MPYCGLVVCLTNVTEKVSEMSRKLMKIISILLVVLFIIVGWVSYQTTEKPFVVNNNGGSR